MQLVQGKDTLQVKRGTRPKLTEVANILKDEVGKYKLIYMVVDVVDECSESWRMDLLEMI